jgi:hypothetical protein
MRKKFRDRKSLESTRFETLEELVLSAIYYALDEKLGDTHCSTCEQERSEEAAEFAAAFCDGQDARQ